MEWILNETVPIYFFWGYIFFILIFFFKEIILLIPTKDESNEYMQQQVENFKNKFIKNKKFILCVLIIPMVFYGLLLSKIRLTPNNATNTFCTYNNAFNVPVIDSYSKVNMDIIEKTGNQVDSSVCYFFNNQTAYVDFYSGSYKQLNCKINNKGYLLDCKEVD